MAKTDTVFAKIQAYFDIVGASVYDTEKGIFGVTDITKIYQFFKDIQLDTKKQFIDLGSGDGRVVIVASLFTTAIGIEFDEHLVQRSKHHNEELQTNATFLTQDYETYDYSTTDILFSFSDHNFTPEFITKLKKEFKGTLYIYEGIFLPEDIPKGKTYWVGQTKIVSYEFRNT